MNYSINIYSAFDVYMVDSLKKRRHPTIDVNQLSASLKQNGAHPHGFHYKYKNFFSQIL
jgi:hypothetical protein